MKKNLVDADISEQQLERELQRSMQKKRHWSTFRNILAILFVLSALGIIATTLFIPVCRVTDPSMEPELKQGETVIAIKTQTLEAGDIAVVQSADQIVIRRVIGVSGEIIQRDNQGELSVNGNKLPEDMFGRTILDSDDITYPFQVPDNRYLLSDGKQMVVCVSEGSVIGKVLLRIWPLHEVGFVD